MASTAVNRWLRPEVYPLFAAVGAAVGICGFQLVRNICFNPEVRFVGICLRSPDFLADPDSSTFPGIDIWVNKEGRSAGVLENFVEGEKYAEHGLRKFVRGKTPEIMPNINSFFSNPSN